ncbi:hypothetical protein L798_02650 [Zootermopsis nevadensis]|uniref:Uncharacterized protein n=2 Tax=Zootermopsis nevadensis TaxID=136037 RepID=A0A067QJM5_ZOONE|nr:hypothetical protein L798_02650 [Zootermopsis nevadensis]
MLDEDRTADAETRGNAAIPTTWLTDRTTRVQAKTISITHTQTRTKNPRKKPTAQPQESPDPISITPTTATGPTPGTSQTMEIESQQSPAGPSGIPQQGPTDMAPPTGGPTGGLPGAGNGLPDGQGPAGGAADDEQIYIGPIDMSLITFRGFMDTRERIQQLAVENPLTVGIVRLENESLIKRVERENAKLNKEISEKLHSESVRFSFEIKQVGEDNEGELRAAKQNMQELSNDLYNKLDQHIGEKK